MDEDTKVIGLTSRVNKRLVGNAIAKTDAFQHPPNRKLESGNDSFKRATSFIEKS